MLPSLAFFFAALVLAITPGPGIAYVVARTAAGGRAEGLASCVGTGLGGMLHVGAAALGLSVLLAQSAVAFSLVKYIGAAYLVYLGIRLLLSDAASAPVQTESTGARTALLEGILVEALNVKTALFFLAFLPQFRSAVLPSSSSLSSWALSASCSTRWSMSRPFSARRGCLGPRHQDDGERGCSTGCPGSRSSAWACMWRHRSEAPNPSIERISKALLRPFARRLCRTSGAMKLHLFCTNRWSRSSPAARSTRSCRRMTSSPVVHLMRQVTGLRNDA